MRTVYMQTSGISWQTLCSKFTTQLQAMPCTMMNGQMVQYPSTQHMPKVQPPHLPNQDCVCHVRAIQTCRGHKIAWKCTFEELVPTEGRSCALCPCMGSSWACIKGLTHQELWLQECLALMP